MRVLSVWECVGWTKDNSREKVWKLIEGMCPETLKNTKEAEYINTGVIMDNFKKVRAMDSEDRQAWAASADKHEWELLINEASNQYNIACNRDDTQHEEAMEQLVNDLRDGRQPKSRIIPEGLRVCHMVDMEIFHTNVGTIEDAIDVVDLLSAYDSWLLSKGLQKDCATAFTVEVMWEKGDATNEHNWEDWYDEDGESFEDIYRNDEHELMQNRRFKGA